jgi:ATP-dependent RNA helicase SUPV3L1/SUV3
VPDGFFYPRITEEQFERAAWLDTLDCRWRKVCPVAGADIEQVPSLQRAWEHWATALAKKVTELKRCRCRCTICRCRKWKMPAGCIRPMPGWHRQPEHFPIRNWPSNCRGKLRIGGRLLHEQNSAARKRQPKLPSLNYR